ncbi:signal peptidase I [Paenibacillus sp. 481]|uniref:signal peptidase I n=1 Tax=Paenibacillus sp. 481 TaxID=2835869 RepID=UPI001E577940|nr:signal peptidase I [Paenibacillus sp. 481]UHA72809.1 signal peptidase I [Paenibacillus sp. 481]
MKQNWLKKLTMDFVVPAAIALTLSLTIQKVAYAQILVNQDSMNQTYEEGDRLLENKWVYKLNEPERGDVVIIEPDFSGERLIKRVVAVAGDRFDIRDGQLYINDKVVEEPHALGNTMPKGMSIPTLVPAGHVIVLGDNRENSKDSRDLGFVPNDSLEGKVEAKLWPWR